MIAADETFEGTFPFEPHFSTAPGFRMHYVDEGEGEPIVCLHGEPTWGYLYRSFVPPLARSNRVIVPDHMGFGKSETPQDREYTLRVHVENLEALLAELDLRDVTLVVQDWGGPIGGAWAARNPERVKRVFVMNTIVAFPMSSIASFMPRLLQSRWFQWIQAGVEDGTVDAVLGNLGSTVLSVMKLIGFENSAAVDDTWIRAYSSPFGTREECIGGVSFPLDVVTGKMAQIEEPPPEGVEALFRKPAMLAEGMRDQAIPPEVAIEVFRSMFGDRPVVELPRAGHFCQEDAPETLVSLIQQFVQANP